MTHPINTTRPAKGPMEIAALGVAAVVATPGLPAEEQIRLIRRILAACEVP